MTSSPAAHATVRVFVSSTFEDFVPERRVLHEGLRPGPHGDAVPSPLAVLRERAMARGAGLEAIDLRWGVSGGAAAAYLTMDRCLTEVDRARATPGPAVLALVGERAGWRPVPRVLGATELPAVVEELTPGDRDVVLRAYRLEENLAPAAYVLRAEAIRAEGEERLRDALTAASTALEWAGHPAACMPATEQEIRRALAGTDGVGEERVLAYLRSFDGADTDAADTDRTGTVRRLRHDLRQHTAALVRDVRVDRGRYAADDMRDYLASFAESVVTDLAPYVDGALDAVLADPDRETRVHIDLAARHRASFRGREGERNRLAGYLTGPATGPLIVTGPGGVGKSALLAVAGTSAAGTPVVLRHIGASPESSVGTALATSVTTALGGDTSGDVWDRLRETVAAGPATVVLDGLDMLPEDDEFLRLRWLPVDWPAGLRLLVSSRDPHHVDLLRRRRPATEHVDLAPLDPQTASILFDDLMSSRNRTVSEPQRDEVARALDRCALPLFVSVLADLASEWNAADQARIDAADIGDAVAAAFDRLAAPERHGPAVVQGVLGLLAASRFGLGDAEIIDALSGDHGFMEAFGARNPHAPRVDRLPYVVWSAVRDDLGTYLAERAVDGVDVVDFLHREFRAIAVAYRADGEPVIPVQARHRRLAETFERQGTDRAGIWFATARRAAGEAAHHLLAVPDGARVDGLLERADYLCAALGHTPFRAGVSRPRPAVADELNGTLRARGYDRAADAITAAAEVVTVHAPSVAGIAGVAGLVVRGAPARGIGGVALRRAAPVPDPVADHRTSVTAAVATTDGAFLATGDTAGWVVWRDTADARPRWVRPGHGAWVTSLALSPDGRTLLSAGDDGAILVWDVATGRGETVRVPGSPSPRPQASHLAFTDATRFVAQSGGLPVRGDVVTGEAVVASSMLFSGDLMRPGDIDPVTNDAAGRWCVERADSAGRPMMVTRLDVDGHRVERVQGAAAAGAAIDAADHLLLSTTAGLELFDLRASERPIRRAPGPVLRSLRSVGDGFLGVDAERRVVHVDAGLRTAVVMRSEGDVGDPFPRFVRPLGTDRVALCYTDGAVGVYATDGGRRIAGHRAGVVLAGGLVSRDGTAGTGLPATTPDVVDCRPGTAPVTLRTPHRRAIVGAVDPGNGEVVTADASGLLVSWGDRTTDTLDLGLPVTCLGELPDAEGAVVGTADCEIHVVGPAPGRRDLERGRRARRPITAVDVAVDDGAPPGSPPAIAAVVDSGLVVRSTADGVVWRPVENRAVIAGTAVAVTPWGMADGNAAGSLRVWDAARDEPVVSWSGAHRGAVTWIGRVGHRLVTAGSSGSVFVVHIATGDVLGATMVPGGVVAGRAVDATTLVLLRGDGVLVTYRVEEQP